MEPCSEQCSLPVSEEDSIPLADTDPSALIDDEVENPGMGNSRQNSSSNSTQETIENSHRPEEFHSESGHNPSEASSRSLFWQKVGAKPSAINSGLLLNECESLESIPGAFSDQSRTQSPSSGRRNDHCNKSHQTAFKSDNSLPLQGDGSFSSMEAISAQMGRHLSLDPDMSPDEVEERARLISQVLELQNTLEDLTSRVDSIKEENFKLRSENSILGQYIENLMQASAVFQPTNPKTPGQTGGPPLGSLGSVVRCTAKAVANSRLLTPSSSSTSSTSTPSDRVKSSSAASTSTGGMSPIF
ncbi:hypothetical protein TCAL_04171 [Tigriopus californicus]|uniref:Short coiled-coil protein A n=1 Tax=Tigriopus californicus TaxID=6832 RepID=A0A553NU29_TIGCA|nr:uncharacterized protein LOC131879575 isoform X1 [Tigriopus californicus]TRY68939.1 hypothetical protein TCAL_04171 [Tigriopus californicus]